MTLTTDSRARLSLSGPSPTQGSEATSWQLAFDPDGEGIREGWTGRNWPEEKSDWVQVPAIWNTTHPDVEGVGFYRKVFNVPASWQGKALQLHFEGASYRIEAWLNGMYVGSHEGAYTPFQFDVTSLIWAGTQNQLVVRVASLSKSEQVDGMVLSESPASKQSWYYTHGGLWGKVYLEASPYLSCQSMVVEPDLYREMVLIEIAIGNRHVESRPVDIHLQITKPDGSLAAEDSSRVAVPPGAPRFTYRVPLPRPSLWSCENPNLYRLRVAIQEGGEEIDHRTIPFGVREFTVHNGQFFLNGEPIFLRGLLLQPNYPITVLTPPTREMMVREIELAKEGGFNLIRAHIRPAPPGYLDLTDQMGMLVYEESSLAWIKDSPRLFDHGRREVRAMIERDRNHPSVVFWGINNENRAVSALNSDDLIRFVRALDPTRVIVDNSGGSMAIDQDYGWTDRATVVPSRSTHRQKIQDMHIYVGAPIPSPVYEWMRTLGISDLPLDVSAHDFGSKAMLEEWNRELRSYRGKVFVSELGCGGMADLDKVVEGFGEQEHLRDAREMRTFRDSLHQGFEARGLDRVFGSVRSLVEATQAAQSAGLRRQIEALLINPRVSGYIITQLNDVAWEFHAGLLDHWRDPKPVYHAVKRLNQTHCLVLKAEMPVVTCGDSIVVALTLVGQHPLQGAEQIHVRVTDPLGDEIETNSQAAPPGAGITELGTICVRTGDRAGEYRVQAQLVKGEETLAESSEVILSLPAVDLASVAANIVSWGEDGLGDTEESPRIDERRVLLAANPASLTDDQWDHLLDAVEMGRVAIIGPLSKRDENAQHLLNERGLDVQLHLGIGNWMGCFHWTPDSDLFKGLPAGGLAGEAYADVLPWYVMSEQGGEVFAGSIRNTQTRREPAAILWYSDIEATKFGQGALFFCQYRIFEKAATNPLAAKMARNLIHLAQSYL